MVQYVILLPLFYNDGRAVEPEKLLRTYEELRNQFGGITLDSVDVTGQWEHRGTLYEDRLRRIIVVGEETAASGQFMRGYKETLKERFDQLEIWIEVHRIELL